MPDTDKTILALDIGHKRIGLALADQHTKLPKPLITLANDDGFLAKLLSEIKENEAMLLVAGLPRGLDGQRTPQTEYVENFVADLKKSVNLPIYWQDEALTSKMAEEELVARGRPYKDEDVDSLAATYILEDFLNEQFQELNK